MIDPPRARISLRLGSKLAGTVAALALVACGGPEPSIPADDGEALLAQLEEVRSAFADDGCDTTLPAAIARLESLAQGLPESTGNEVRRTLDDGIARLATLAEQDCEIETPTDTVTQPTVTLPTVPEETVTEETETEETETSEPETEPEPEPEPEEPVDPDFVPPGQQRDGPPGRRGSPEGFTGNGNGADD